MNYTIEKYDQLISKLSTPDKANGMIKKEDISNIISQCAEEKEKVRLHIMEEVFNAPDEKALLLLIDKYQAVFIRLIDQVHAYRQAAKKPEDYKELAKCLFDHIHDLLSFLQVHYAKYFNSRQKMPYIKMEHIIKELQPKTDTINAALRRTVLHEKLIKIILQPLEKFISSNHISYQESQYMKTVSNELLAIDTTMQPEDTGTFVKKLLVSLDYNTPDICTYYINELDLLVSEEESVQNKLRLLKFELKKINQITLRPDHILFPELPSLKEQLINWLNEELYFHEIEQTIIAATVPTHGIETKIHTSMTIPQLALLFRLLKEEQLITNTNQSELLKAVANNFTTMHKESFSHGHLHGKYYKIDNNTKKTVYDILLRLLHLSRKIG